MQYLIKSLSSLILALTLSSCAPPNLPELGPVYVDSRFISYLNQYKADKLLYLNTEKVKPVSIKFKPSTEYIGVCLIWTFGQRLIEIDPIAWESLSESGKYILLVHELGHCDLDLDHTTESTIMQEYLMDDFRFNADRDYFLKKLFLEGK
jgi:hypothetical protein